ncbi:hypothetical protein [Actinokineospora bangkokensis]|uniref:SWIM-type domain-containing protein n=1 Tax=Actinokineospora bangkokensis TaxID=1193682 RepID=A0A1Q9LLV7_9PSEU|nr:hypothetical protein [Actinokineospora bangkokensis]OLR93001.1 hypothetical protein BJP25_18735 [Actinokineospora bangkokensis]
MTVPPVAPAVVADVLDALPPRLRKRVDSAVDRAATWAVRVDGEAATATLDEDTTLRWVLHDGVLTSADDLECGCLLAPKCLHRGIAVAAAEIGQPPEAGQAPEAGEPADGVADTAPAETPPEAPVVEVRADERAAAAGLWAACATVLRAGAAGSGAVVRAELLRAVHTARVAGLHRASAGGLRVASALADARAGAATFDREVLAADLLELMLLCHDLRTGTGDPALLRGTARREYLPIGSLRLYGLCTEAVVASSGYAGVVTHVVTEDGVLWTVQAVVPGGPARVAAAADGAVALGESGLSQRELGRGGLLLSGGTASPDRRLGAGKSVRAVAASGVDWTAPPLTALWERPLPEQVERAARNAELPDGLRPSGDDLLFLDAVVVGPAGPALRVTVDGADVDLIAFGERARANLRVLAGAPGLRTRFIARLRPDQPGTAVAIAASGGLALPAALAGRVDLGLDQVQRGHLGTEDARQEVSAPRQAGERDRVPAPLRPVANAVHRVAFGGRSVAAITGSARDTARLDALGMSATAAVLADLAATARDRERDAFGRVREDTTDAFPLAWLRAALHVREMTRAVTRREWVAAAQPQEVPTGVL